MKLFKKFIYKIDRYRSAQVIMHNEFFPSPDNEKEIENSIMTSILSEKQKNVSNDSGISTKNWIIAGLVIFISFAIVFLELDFQNMTSRTGLSFLLPLGIIFGCVLTCYCAIFIGSHLQEFSEKFGI